VRSVIASGFSVHQISDALLLSGVEKAARNGYKHKDGRALLWAEYDTIKFLPSLLNT
jgi:hypothetical protein